MSQNPVNLSAQGPPTTKLPEVDAAVRHELKRALDADPTVRRGLVADIVSRNPRWIDAWVALGDLARDEIERYACYRVAYHRGLDLLRQNGWRGSGYLRWNHEPNRGFLRALSRLGVTAGTIGELDEAERCRLFVLQLEPNGVADEA